MLLFTWAQEETLTQSIKRIKAVEKKNNVNIASQSKMKVTF